LEFETWELFVFYNLLFGASKRILFVAKHMDLQSIVV